MPDRIVLNYIKRSPANATHPPAYFTQHVTVLSRVMCIHPSISRWFLLMICAAVQTVEEVIFIVIPDTPLALVLVQTKSFFIVSFCNKQLLEVRNAIKFAIIQRVRFHPEDKKIHTAIMYSL